MSETADAASAPPREAYICSTIHGDFVAFVRCDQGVRIFLPNDVIQTNLMIRFEEWEEIKKSYPDNPDSSNIGQYNDVINAAWQCLGLRNPINRNQVKALKNELGRYFPRIWRGAYDRNRIHCYRPIDARSTYGGTFVGANVATSIIFDAVQNLFRFVEPAKENLRTFSHKIREALILACTEVESAWRSVLEINSSKKASYYSTNDYYRLVEPLHLKEWTVVLRDYPDLGDFSPFASWEESKPTKSLPWYDAYNAVKHHREERFQRATYESLINAAAALHILQSAQFGPEIYDRLFENESSPFFTTSHPVHDLADLYAPDLCSGMDMTPKPYFG